MKRIFPYCAAAIILAAALLVPGLTQAARTGTNLPAITPDRTDIIDPLILRVQKVLRKIGLYKGPLDGLVGPKTLKAVHAYQKIRGRKPSGRITQKLADQLETEDKVDALLNRLKKAKATSIDAALQALLNQDTTRELLGDTGKTEIADPTRDTATCFKTPSPSCLLTEATESSKAIFKPEMRDWALGELLVAQAKLGLAKEAMGTVQRIGDPRLIMVALRNIAQAQASEGRDDEAARAAKIIPDLIRRAEAFAAISKIQAVRSNDAAVKSITELLLLVDAVSDPLKKAALFGKGAVIQNHTGNAPGARKTLARAEALANSLTDPHRRETALGYVATAWAEIGAADRALDVLKEMGRKNERTPVLVSTAIAQAKAGDAFLAIETAQEIDSLRYKSVVLARIAAAQEASKKGGDALETLDQARDAASEIKKPFARDYAISRIALTQSWIGRVRKNADELDAAAAFADTIKNKRLRAETLWTIAGQLRRLSGADRAKVINGMADDAADEIKSQLSQVWMFGDISLVHLKHGETAAAWKVWQRGLKIAEGIHNAWGRTRALGKLAATLIRLDKTLIKLDKTK
jgi:peptidoglycan hydrolase-like protein with peptidoglycan-binding domain